MNPNDSLFLEWVEMQFSRQSADYRQRLKWITDTVTQYAEGNLFETDHVRISLELLRDVPRPVIPKYEGEVSAEDRAWYAACKKPNYAEMLREAEDRVKKLLTSATLDR